MSSLPHRIDRKKVTRSSPKRDASRIIGQGEIAELIRQFDWSNTPLGSVEIWSDTLVTTVNLLLASRHPMFLWWGPDLIQFYNDGYRPSIREDKHPSAIGQRGIECWPEIWPIIGPQIETVMGSGHSTWNTNQLVPIKRNGKLEEVYWTYGYSPVRDKDGDIQGTLVVCSETTEQVLSERRLRTLLGIVLDSDSPEQASHPESLLLIAQQMVAKLAADSADFPFAALYLLTQGEIALAGSSATPCNLAVAENWPLLDASRSRTPRLIEDLSARHGDVICDPWPEPVSRAYVLPLQMPESSVQAVLVVGISPRLPFDDPYRTFFELVGARVASLLHSEVQKIAVAKAADRFSRLAEANPFGMVIGGLNGELTYINSVLLNALGYTEEDVNSGKVRWDALTPPESADEDARAVKQLRASGRCDVYEKAYIAKDGTRIPILIGATIIDSPEDESQVAAFVTDLTPLKTAEEALRKANNELEKKVIDRTAALEAEVLERKRAEASLRELTGRLLRTQDEERRHLARELHDHAGQTLVALDMNFAVLHEATLSQDSQVTKMVAESRQLSDDLSKELRTLSYLLHPPLLDEVGIKSALRWYVEGFSKRSKIEVELDLPDNFRRLPKELDLVIFRVVQEALTNIHRHSGSASARISLSRTEDTVDFEISDCGKGISPEERRAMAPARAGVGVRGMQERVHQFGGTLRISSNSAGTKVSVTIPIADDAQ
ncbi:MAG: PAS domain-containing sensor histidine kinase [Candidatus Sulfotelmatobacter sp.]